MARDRLRPGRRGAARRIDAARGGVRARFPRRARSRSTWPPRSRTSIFEHATFPSDLKDEIYAYLSANHADERKAGQTDAQFFYGARKRAFGPFKRQIWDLPAETRDRIAGDLEASFSLLMQRLHVADSAELVDRFVPRVDVPSPMPPALAAALAGEAVHAGAAKEAMLEEVEGE